MIISNRIILLPIEIFDLKQFVEIKRVILMSIIKGGIF